MMDNNLLHEVFSTEKLDDLFPKDRADVFFDALYGDASDGAYDIFLKFKSAKKNVLQFEFQLEQRPGKCLACNLTYGLPEVFSRHPVINIADLAKGIMRLLNKNTDSVRWKIGATREVSEKHHVIPLDIFHEA
ncbi:MAG: pancreas/duodenum homeobox protein 1 [Desulfobacterales bacterium]